MRIIGKSLKKVLVQIAFFLSLPILFSFFRYHEIVFFLEFVWFELWVLKINVIQCVDQRFKSLLSDIWFQLAFPDVDEMPSHRGEFHLCLDVSATKKSIVCSLLSVDFSLYLHC